MAEDRPASDRPSPHGRVGSEDIALARNWRPPPTGRSCRLASGLMGPTGHCRLHALPMFWDAGRSCWAGGA
jgi:hypothetical protein